MYNLGVALNLGYLLNLHQQNGSFELFCRKSLIFRIFHDLQHSANEFSSNGRNGNNIQHTVKHEKNYSLKNKVQFRALLQPTIKMQNKINQFVLYQYIFSSERVPKCVQGDRYKWDSSIFSQITES